MSIKTLALSFRFISIEFMQRFCRQYNVKYIALFFCFLSVTFAAAGGTARLDGFDGIIWKENYNDVKKRFRTLASSSDTKEKIEIVHDIEDREIIIKRKGIIYRYVFYKKPESLAKADLDNNNQGNTDNNTQQNEKNQAKFFFVEINFTIMPADKLYEKLTAKYGQRTGNTVNEEMNGAYLWQQDEGMLVQQVQAYEKAPYTRSLYYISNKVREDISKDLQNYRFEKELKDLKNLVP